VQRGLAHRQQRHEARLMGSQARRMKRTQARRETVAVRAPMLPDDPEGWGDVLVAGLISWMDGYVDSVGDDLAFRSFIQAAAAWGALRGYDKETALRLLVASYMELEDEGQGHSQAGLRPHAGEGDPPEAAGEGD
jgi:hypothetical protein